jgi:ribosomal protein L18
MSTWRPHLLKVFLSNKYVYASILHQAHPSAKGHFVATASTLQREVREKLRSTNHSTRDIAAAQLVGQLLAAKAKELQLQEVAFDRGDSRWVRVVCAAAGAGAGRQARAGAIAAVYPLHHQQHGSCVDITAMTVQRFITFCCASQLIYWQHAAGLSVCKKQCNRCVTQWP